MKILRATDLHADAYHEEKLKSFVRHIREEDPGLVLIGGDIADGNANKYLEIISSQIWQDIYYVLGNHDFYGHSVKTIRDNAIDAEKIRYLTNRGSIHIDENTTIVGHDGWGDGRNGYVDSAFMDREDPNAVRLRDFYEIDDLKFVYSQTTRPLFRDKLKELGDEAANHFKTHLQNTNKNVIVLTHVPPFNEACFYRRHNGPLLPQNEFWAPFFSCKAAGDVLIEFADQNPEKKILVLAGHTHERSEVMIRSNMKIIVGQGSYHDPRYDIIDTDEVFLAL